MIAPKTQFKIGLLVICTLAALGAIAIMLGLRARTPVVRYHTYFDESVSGLDVGSVVEFRGLRIGTVGVIALAPDRLHVDVALDLALASALDLGLPERAAALCAKLDSSGITGVKYIDLEPANPASPAPVLAFVPDRNYIASRLSLLHTLEARADQLGRLVPLLVERATFAVNKIARLLDTLDDEKVVTKVSTAVAHTDAAIGDLRRVVRDLGRAELPAKAASVLDHLGRVDNDGDLERGLRDVGAAARAFRELVQEVEREPDMLIKGRARSARP